MNNEKITISFIEDKPQVLEFLVETFAAAEGFNTRGQYTNAEDAITFLPQSNTDVAIVDIRLPGKSGIECVREVKKKRPEMLFLMFTVLDQDDELFESLKVGADGYLLKTTDGNEILDAVKELLNGGSPMSPSIARKVTRFFRENKKGKDKGLAELSERENEVLTQLAQGLTYGEIGEELKITTGTVKQHINKIYGKLQVKNSPAALNVYWTRKRRPFFFF